MKPCSSLAWLLGASLVCLTSSRGAHAQERTWDGPLREARAHYAAQRWTEAARAFRQADERLGGYPYDESVYDDDGRWVHAADRQPVRDSFQCPWALAVLAAPPTGDSDEAADARHDAIARAELSCTPAERARAALLHGDALQASLRLAIAGLPPESLTVPAEARAWAERAHQGPLPPARDLPEALRFIQAHAAAQHGLTTQCQPPFGRRVRAPLDSPDEVYEEDEESPTAPFESGTPEPIAFVRCTFEEPVSPYEEPGMGPGADSVEYLLVREPGGGIRIAGPFRGMTDWECWTGVVQGDLGHGVVPIGARNLYTVTRVEGYSGYDEDQESYIADELVVCDPGRGACSTLPISVFRRTVTFSADDEPIVNDTRWRSDVSFSGGRVRLTTARGAPAPLRRFTGRGVTLDELFSSPPVDGRERTLFPQPAGGAAAAGAVATSTSTVGSGPAASTTSSACPWRVADGDGATNVRADASSRAAVVTSLTNGTTVTVTERRGRWWRISAPSAGWLWAPNLAQRCP